MVQGHIQDEFVFLFFADNERMIIPARMADKIGYEQFRSLTELKINAT
jgi:hypothetical protein